MNNNNNYHTLLDKSKLNANQNTNTDLAAAQQLRQLQQQMLHAQKLQATPIRRPPRESQYTQYDDIETSDAEVDFEISPSRTMPRVNSFANHNQSGQVPIQPQVNVARNMSQNMSHNIPQTHTQNMPVNVPQATNTTATVLETQTKIPARPDPEIESCASGACAVPQPQTQTQTHSQQLPTAAGDRELQLEMAKNRVSRDPRDTRDTGDSRMDSRNPRDTRDPRMRDPRYMRDPRDFPFDPYEMGPPPHPRFMPQTPNLPKASKRSGFTPYLIVAIVIMVLVIILFAPMTSRFVTRYLGQSANMRGILMRAAFLGAATLILQFIANLGKK